MSPTPRHRALAATAAAAVGLSLALTAPITAASGEPGAERARFTAGYGSFTPAAKDPSAQIRRAITPRGLRTHLQAFETLGKRYDGRHAPTSAGGPSNGYVAAARYVELKMRQAGYRVSRDYFTYESSNVVTESLSIDAATPVDVPVIAMSYTNSTPPGGVTGELVEPTDASKHGCTVADYPDADPEATQVALISRGTCSFGEKATAAGEAGYEAAVIYNNTEGPLNGTVGDARIEGSAPVGGVTQADGATLVEAAAAGTPVTLELVADYFTATDFNVIATSRTGNPNNTVLLGGHLDGVEGSTAVNDNGTGVAALLEVGKHLRQVKGQRNRVQFAFWGSEEVGLVGSTQWVADRTRAELDRIATYLNFDMLGSPNHIIGVYDADESSFPASAPVTAGSIETEQMFRRYFRGQKQPAVDTEFSGRSDYQAFLLNGVAAGGLFTGADGVKTPAQQRLFGGTAGQTYDGNYHTPSDNLANVAVGPLHTMADAIGHMAATLSRSTEQLVVPQSAPRRQAVREARNGLALGDRR